MRITLNVEAVDGGWKLCVLDDAGAPIPDPVTQDPLVRMIRRPGDPPEEPLWRFPMPPEAEMDELPDGLADSENDLRRAYQKILNRDTSDQVIERFGRYLFTTLLGQDLWEKIQSIAKNRPYELALSWAADEELLNRYPWEMLHDSNEFIAFQSNVSITRRISSHSSFPDEIDFPPRVLFVMGTGLDDDVIQPGAEYMSLVRNLFYAGLGGRLQTKVLVRTTTELLEKTIDTFRPTIVHFICHGWFDDENATYLELYDKATRGSKRVYASTLLGLLSAGQPPAPPPIVILSACNTATVEEQSRSGEPAIPLAAMLIRGDDKNTGVPIVVGMAGRVADQACRLFTRRFYEALLMNEDIAQAVAEGRRAAAKHGGYNPSAEVDWALPTLFVASNVKQACLKFIEQPWLATTQEAAKKYRDNLFPPFCDRLEVLRKHDLLLAEKQIQQAEFFSDRVQILAFSTSTGFDDDQEGPRYGRSWQLKNLASRAARDGHIPCLIDKKNYMPGDPWPSTLPELLDLLDLALEDTANLFNLNPYNYDSCVKRVLNAAEGAPAPDNLPGELKNRWKRPLVERLARALRHDLLEFLAIARAMHPDQTPPIKLLLLFDDLHRMGEAAVRGLLDQLLGDFGLRMADDDVRIAFTYALQGPPDWDNTSKAIIDWLGEASRVEGIALESFCGLEERLAYQRLLYNWREGGKRDGELVRQSTVVETSQNKGTITWFFDNLSKEVRGIPKDLVKNARPIIEAMMVAPEPIRILRDAKDDIAYKLHRPGENP